MIQNIKTCYTIQYTNKVWQYMYLEHTFLYLLTNESNQSDEQSFVFCIRQRVMSIQHEYQLNIDDAVTVAVVAVYRKHKRGTTSCKEHLVTLFYSLYFATVLILLLVCLIYLSRNFMKFLSETTILLAHFHIHSECSDARTRSFHSLSQHLFNSFRFCCLHWLHPMRGKRLKYKTINKTET